MEVPSLPSLRKFDASIVLLHKLRGVVVVVVVAVVIVVVVVIVNQIRGSTPVNYGLHRAPQKTDWKYVVVAVIQITIRKQKSCRCYCCC